MVKFKVIYKDGSTKILYATNIAEFFVKLAKAGNAVKEVYIVHRGTGKLTKSRYGKYF